MSKTELTPKQQKVRNISTLLMFAGMVSCTACMYHQGKESMDREAALHPDPGPGKTWCNNSDGKEFVCTYKDLYLSAYGRWIKLNLQHGSHSEVCEAAAGSWACQRSRSSGASPAAWSSGLVGAAAAIWLRVATAGLGRFWPCWAASCWWRPMPR